MNITKELLVSVGAKPNCDYIKEFAVMYPDGAEITEENALIALDAGLNVIWLVRLLPHKEQVRLALAWARRVQHVADDQRVRDCLDAVQCWLNGEDIDLKATEWVAWEVSEAAWKAAWMRMWPAAVAASWAVNAAAWAAWAAVAAPTLAAGAAARAAVKVAEAARAAVLKVPEVEHQEQVKMLVKSLLKVEGNL